jgi:drug/metabolite transporter (DMT)-like permease
MPLRMVFSFAGQARADHNCFDLSLEMKTETKGMLLGLTAVALFSLTLPATRMALESFHPIFIGTGRGLLAATLASIYLYVSKSRRPTWQEFKYLLLVVMGVGLGFPIFTALAMGHVDASHGGVMLGIMPLTTAAVGALFFKERPSVGFWVMALIGSALVIVFSIIRGNGSLHWADLALLIAVVTGSTSYAVGGFLSKSLGGLQVISWALVIASPLYIAPAIWFSPDFASVSSTAWTGFLYAALVSQFLSFLPWFRGLALGGIARVGQTQLIQPFITILFSAWLLGESIDLVTIGFALAVFVVVATGRAFGIKRKS